MNNNINNNINVNQSFGVKRMEKREPQDFQEQVEIMLETMSDRAEREVPEYGDFAPVLEVFNNLDDDSQYYVGKYGLKIYKMPKSAQPDPKMRYVEAAAYIPSGDYKADQVVGSGSKKEIQKLLKDPEFVKKLCQTYGELLEMIEDQY